MPAFSGNPVALADGTAYERVALQPACDLLFGTAAHISSTTKVDLSRVQLSTSSYEFDVVRTSQTATSDQAVAQAMEKMRALLFVTAFKIQDMIVEWILKENGSSEWTFSGKIAFYKRHNGDATWTEPDLLLSTTNWGKGFWQIYEALSDARNTINHNSAFQLSPAGVITVAGRRGSYTLDTASQAAYAELIIAVSETLADKRTSVIPVADVIEHALSTLSTFHSQTVISQGRKTYEALEITVPSNMLSVLDPCCAVIDLRGLKAQLAQSSNSTVSYLTKFTIKAGERTLTTFLEPFIDIPDTVTLNESDPKSSFTLS